MFKKGDWVYDDQLIGCIKQVHPDGLLDIIIYDRSGKKIGRASEALDGPTGFEPCCDPDNWKVIFPPTFPLKRNYYLSELVEEIQYSKDKLGLTPTSKVVRQPRL